MHTHSKTRVHIEVPTAILFKIMLFAKIHCIELACAFYVHFVNN